MSGYCDRMKWKNCSFLIFQTVFHVVVCQVDSFWCGDKQEQAFTAVRGQNISRRFRLQDALADSQALVWGKGVTLDDRSSDFIDNASANQGRYKLKKVPGETALDLFIAFIEQSDSGNHIIKIHQGAQALCSVAVFNLTIESTEPICSTLLDQENGRLQMSCQWFQVNVGYQVQLRAGDQVVYEYETQGMNSEGDFNSTNTVSVYLSSDMAYEQIVPSTCLSFNRLRHYNETCEFLRVQNHAIRNDQTASQRFKFECCTRQETDVVSWWYNNGSNLYSLNLPDEIIVNKERMSFFCGVQHGNLTVRVYSMGNVLFADGKKCNLFLSPASERKSQENGNSSCENILFNATMIKKDIYRIKNNQDMTSAQYNTIETDVSSDAPITGEKRSNTVPAWVWVLLVLSVIFCLTTGFINCYYFALRTYRYHFENGMNDGILMNSSASTGDAGAQSQDVANSQTQPLQIYMEHNHQGDFAHQGALGQGAQGTERKKQFHQNLDEPSSLHTQLQFGESKSSCIVHRPPNHGSVVEDHGGTTRRTTTCSKASTNEQKGSDLAGAQKDNTAYCSVDDVKDTPADIAKELKPSQAAAVVYPKQSAKGHEAHQDHARGNASTSSSFTSETSKLKKKVRGTSKGLDALYAKPDMSRKTKKVTCLRPDYGDPEAPGSTYEQDPLQDLGHSSDFIVQCHADFYDNMITNPTEELIDDGNLCIESYFVIDFLIPYVLFVTYICLNHKSDHYIMSSINVLEP